MNLSFTTTPKLIAAIFAVLLAVLLFCAYKVNTNPSGSALTGFIFACTALVVIALNTKIDVVFQTLRDELEPRTGTASGSVNAVEPYRQRSQREDLEQSLVHALAPGLLNRMDGSGVGLFIRQAADAVLGVGGTGCGSLNSRLEAAKVGLETSAQRVGRAWASVTENVTADAKVAGSNQSLQAFGSAVAAYEASLTTGDVAGRVDTELHLSPAGAAADQHAEAEIVAKGLTAPRVTAEQIQALMAKLSWSYEQPEGTTSTFAHAYLDRFYLATGHSACVSPENFNLNLGMKYAREQAEGKARDKLWELEGYLLRSRLKGNEPTA